MTIEISDLKDPVVTLGEIDRDNVYDILDLSVSPEQRVATNAKSLAEAYVHEEAWARAVYADDTPVGFLMLYVGTLKEEPEKGHIYFLWRLMIDSKHQGKGYGRAAVELAIQYVKSNPKATDLFTSYVPGDGNPEGFYRKLGFEHTGERVDGEEPEMRLRLTRP